MHVTHHGFAADHLLAIEARNDTEGSVCGWMLWSEVDRHAPGFEFHIDAHVGGLAGDVGSLANLLGAVW